VKLSAHGIRTGERRRHGTALFATIAAAGAVVAGLVPTVATSAAPATEPPEAAAVARVADSLPPLRNPEELSTRPAARPATGTKPSESAQTARRAARTYPLVSVKSGSVALRQRPAGPERPNGRLAWIDGRDGGLGRSSTSFSLHADLSRRTLELRRGARVVKRMSVSVGRPGSSTPTGRFAVTDKLDGSAYSGYFGCCILAMSGTQPNLPAGWPGGNRLAIHGTSSPQTIGQAGSAGCLRAGEEPLRDLMRRVPVGTPVFVSA